jgi:hypothetical protein
MFPYEGSRTAGHKTNQMWLQVDFYMLIIEIDAAKKWSFTRVGRGIAPDILAEEMDVVANGPITWNIDDILQ